MRYAVLVLLLAASPIAGCRERPIERAPAPAVAVPRRIAEPWPAACPRRHFTFDEGIPIACRGELRPIEHPDLLGLATGDRRYAWYAINLDAYYLACRDRGCFIKTAVYDRFAGAA